MKLDWGKRRGNPPLGLGLKYCCSTYCVLNLARPNAIELVVRMLAGSLGELLDSLDLQADGALGGGDNSRHLELVSRCSFTGGLLFIRSAEDVE